MKKCIIVSDNHGDQDLLYDLLSIYDDADLFIHCGDSEADPRHPIWKKMETVQGNMDWKDAFPLTRTFSFGNKRIFVTHGHLFGVKSGLGDLILQAESEKADIVLFGHTHIPYCEMHKDMLLLNPGSISLPKGKEPVKMYVVLNQEEDGFRVQYKDEHHRTVSEKKLSFSLFHSVKTE